jgi:hypothetical protein
MYGSARDVALHDSSAHSAVITTSVRRAATARIAPVTDWVMTHQCQKTLNRFNEPESRQPGTYKRSRIAP